MSKDYNPLILLTTGQAGDLGDTEFQSGGPKRLTCLGIWPSEVCHASIWSGIHQFRSPRR